MCHHPSSCRHSTTLFDHRHAPHAESCYRQPAATAATALSPDAATSSQALEWAPYGIQVNSIAPGLFPDIMTGGQERFDEMTARARQTVPVGPHGELREAGLLALYLASSASDYMTGQTLMLDGGLGL